MRTRGVSLIEIIVALSLVGLIILFLFGLLPSTGLLSQQAEHQAHATALADELLTRLDCLAFDTLESNQGTLNQSNQGPLNPYLSERVLKDGTRMVPEVTLELIPPSDHLIQAVIVVRWKTQRRSLEHRVIRRFSSVNR
ncbi:MAG: prepilin-type N-terminal cleavage/methylation domain-containing protein [Candidatus Eremiobacteraeota bacterium]|nr:prepilin-type N-terminal cleavage/methylation domain-containing protein [Candidatus Eremiobacteraeota bacterium]